LFRRSKFQPDEVLAPKEEEQEIKNCDERDEIRGCFIEPTDCHEETEGDTERSVFWGILFVV
jgi:hypothetical protein